MTPKEFLKKTGREPYQTSGNTLLKHSLERSLELVGQRLEGSKFEYPHHDWFELRYLLMASLDRLKSEEESK